MNQAAAPYPIYTRPVVWVAAVLAVILLAVGGWFAYWRLAGSAASHRAHINRVTYEQQTTYRDEMIRKIGDVRAIDVQIAQSPDQAAPLRAQRAAVVAIVCRDNTHINGALDPDTQSFVTQECR